MSRPAGLIAALAIAAAAAAEGPLILFDFADADVSRWIAVHDVVMGGVSAGGLSTAEGGIAVFDGEVSLAYGGGFASVRTRPAPVDLSAFAGIALRVRGDGKRYDLNLRTDSAFDGLYYKARFETPKGEWTDIRLPFAAFAPTYRGRVVGGAPPLDPAKIASFGLMISDKQAGPFRLELRTVSAYLP